jgi:hypothetical protein
MSNEYAHINYRSGFIFRKKKKLRIQSSHQKLSELKNIDHCFAQSRLSNKTPSCSMTTLKVQAKHFISVPSVFAKIGA